VEVTERKILRFPQVVERTGLSRSSLYGRVKSGEFPAPVQLGIGRAVGFLEREVSAWIAALPRSAREESK
jgi:prophage regulatory protein